MVGSQVCIKLAKRGLKVTALVRSKSAKISGTKNGEIFYRIADLNNPKSVRDAIDGIDIVINTANGIIPQKRKENAKKVNLNAISLVQICDNMGVNRFIQSSVPTHKLESKVPELSGKRTIEQQLINSSMQSIIVRNPAFMDVWLVMCGFKEAENKSEHATTKRNYGFMNVWKGLVGNFASKWGLFITPGNSAMGSPLISTNDVAEILVGAAIYSGNDNLIIESGGPEWLTWNEVAKRISIKIGKKKLRTISFPSWISALLQKLVTPFSESAGNVLGLIRFVSTYQPNWNSEPVIKMLNLPKQQTLDDYLDQHLG